MYLYNTEQNHTQVVAIEFWSKMGLFDQIPDTMSLCLKNSIGKKEENVLEVDMAKEKERQNNWSLDLKEKNHRF